MSKTVLVVDDDKLARHSLAATLKNANLEVEEAGNGAEALKLAEEQKPELIVTDIHMPDIDGLEMIEKLRKEDWGKDIPVIILTVDEAPSTINQALAAGVTVYLSKATADPQGIADQVVTALG
jgi:CheY-like chemotaxis protein